MPQVSIKIDGVDKVLRKLGTAKGVAALVKPMEESVVKVREGMADYPLDWPENTYVRTGKLGQSWTGRVQQHSNGVTGKIGTNRSYAPWVQSQQFQARVHRGRWQTDAMVIDRLRPWIVARFKRAIDQALNRSV